MWRDLLHNLFGPLAFSIMDARVRRYGDLAFPHDPPISHGSGSDPDRILIIGGVIVRGMGVASYDLALPGQLARQLARYTGRGADIETRGFERFDAFTAAETLRREDLERFDAIVVNLGVREAISGRTSRQWRADLAQMLEAMGTTVPSKLPVLILAMTPFASVMALPGFIERWLARQIERLNSETERACVDSTVAEYVRFAPTRVGIEYGRDAAAVYESWATALVPALAAALESGVASRDHADVHVHEADRQHALDVLDVSTARDSKIDRLVDLACEMLEMDSAAVNFIDHDRQWTKSSSGRGMKNLPRSEAICNITIKDPGVSIVEDMDEDSRFRFTRWTKAPHHLRFYAGYPLEAPGGERVGAFCVMDRAPGTFTIEQTTTLRDLALRVQAVLWEHQPGTP